MAQINVKVSASNVDRNLAVDLKTDTPIHIMFRMIQNNDAPAYGNIWKMTKTGRAQELDSQEVLFYFGSLEKNGVKDGDLLELIEFHL